MNGTVYYIDEMAPEELKATAPDLCDFNVFRRERYCGKLRGGWMIDNYGLKTLYL